jgi:cell division protein FtsW (lipid II flippase)
VPEKFRTYLRHTSFPIIAAMIALMGIGATAIRVAEKADPGAFGYASRHIVFACIGLGVFIAMTIIPYQRVGRSAYALFGVTIVLLVAVLLLPPPPGRREAHRWLGVGWAAFQPSELAKLSYVLLLGWYLRYGDHYRRLRGLIVPFVLTFVPMVLILVEPDLGTCLLFLPTLYFMLFMAGAKLRHLLGIVAVGTAVLLLPVPYRITEQMSTEEIADRKALSYGTLRWGGKEYLLTAAPLAIMEHRQVRRIDGWRKQGDPQFAMNKGYQLRKSKMVLGSGMWTGGGDWEGAGAFFPTLPEDHTDFIFSVIGGRWGFLGCAAVLGLYVAIFVFGVEIAVITYDPFGRLLAVGVLGMLFSQVFVNVGMTMGMMPITGMTLPLVSYGGSSLVVNCAALGLLVNVGQRRPMLLAKHPFEHEEKKEKQEAPYGVLTDKSNSRRGTVRVSKVRDNTGTR